LPHWEAQRLPSFQAAFERMDPADATPLKQERHTGAGRFVRSAAVDDEVSIAGDVRGMLIEGIDRDPPRAGKHVRGKRDIERAAEVEDGDLLPSLDSLLENLRLDPRDSKLAEEESPTDVPEQDVGAECGRDYQGQDPSQVGGAQDHHLDRIAE